MIEEYLRRYPTGLISAALDDTKLRKTGRNIPSAFWQRDPLSPPFHVNLLYGLRFLGASLIFPHYKEGDVAARAAPVRFVECPAVKKPGKRADEEERRDYREAIKIHNLSRDGLQVMKGIRDSLDLMGGRERTVLIVVDGSLCNRTVFKADLDRMELLARCRKDARLCFPAPRGSRRLYAPERFTPEGVRQDENIPWKRAKVHFGGAWRKIRYKQVKGVLWRRGAGVRRLRLLVIAPQPYKLSPHARTHYRQPAYLLTTDDYTPAALLIQAYFDRWQIEVNHREIKDILGVGQAQVWSARSVPRQPAFAVASYSLLLLAGLLEFGPGGAFGAISSSLFQSGERTPNAPRPWTSSPCCERKSTKRLLRIVCAQRSLKIRSPTLILNPDYCPNSRKRLPAACNAAGCRVYSGWSHSDAPGFCLSWLQSRHWRDFSMKGFIHTRHT